MTTTIFDSRAVAAPVPLRARLIGLGLFLAVANVAAWGWAAWAFAGQPVLLGTALLAYGLGLRHAIDADHIAAIDNATRKLVQDGGQPVGVGLFFALGHSLVVLLAAAATAFAAASFAEAVAAWKDVGELVATGVAVLFLFAIAVANLVALRPAWRAWRRARRTDAAAAPTTMEDLDRLTGGGLLTRLFRPLFHLLTRSWHLMPLGFLFGLGFETATEVGLLGLSAAEAARGLPVWNTLVFPALFAAGMALVDAANGVMMLGAYRWAFHRPARKLGYNLAVTTLSATAAILVGSIELLGLLSERAGLEGNAWHVVGTLGENLGALGAGLVALFGAVWIISALMSRAGRMPGTAQGN